MTILLRLSNIDPEIYNLFYRAVESALEDENAEVLLLASEGDGSGGAKKGRRPTGQVAHINETATLAGMPIVFVLSAERMAKVICLYWCSAPAHFYFEVKFMRLRALTAAISIEWSSPFQACVTQITLCSLQHYLKY